MEVACPTERPLAQEVLTDAVGQKYTDICRARTEQCPQDVALVPLRLLLGNPEVGAGVIVGCVRDDEVKKEGKSNDV